MAIVGSALAGAVGPAGQAADLPHDPAGEGDEVAAEKRSARLLGVHGRLPERCGRHDVAGGRGPQHPLGDAAPLALLGQLDEAVRLERPPGGS